jgi:putative ABC transport system substrate-binding protein
MKRIAALATVVALLVAASPLSVEAQSAVKAPRIAYLGFQGESLAASPLRDSFVRGLRDLGYVPGQNIVLDVRSWATGKELPHILSEVLRHKPDIIFVGPPIAAMTARQATRSVPIVCASCGDPVENGLAASLARPGGNVTGFASLSAELIGKRFQLIEELLPGISRVAFFVYPANPGTPRTLSALDDISRALGIAIQRLEIRVEGDFENAFQSAARSAAGAVLLQDDPLNRAARTQIAKLALRHRLPVVSGLPDVAEAGTILAYGPNRIDMSQRSAGLVDRILKGASPASLPFEQASQFELVVNLKIAKTLGLTIPSSVLLRVTRTIE